MRTLARVAAIGGVTFAVSALVIAAAVAATYGDRVEPGTIVVVGDPATPGMQDVVDELRQNVAHGDDLRTSLDLNGTSVAIVVIALLWMGVGAMIVWRQPGNWAGWLFLITGAPLPLSMLSGTVVVAALKAGTSFPLVGLVAWVGEFALFPIALIPLLFLLYPDGHPPSPRWRWTVVGLVGGAFLSFVGFLVRPGPYNNWRDDGIVYANPLGIDGFRFGGTLIGLGTILMIGAAISAAIAVVVRFRRSSGEERQQMRLIALVAGLAGGGIAATITIGVVASALGSDEEGVGSVVFMVLWSVSILALFVGIPIAYLVAIFRYRLWELDVVIKKTAVALVLTLLLAGVGLFAIYVPGQVAFWGGNELGVLIGVIAGALLVPLFRLARRIARRIVFGKRATQQEVLTAFGERVGESYSVVDVLPRMVQVLANGTGATSARVLLRVGRELREEAAVGEPLGEEHLVPVVYEGEELGALAATFPPNDPIDVTKTQLMEHLASQASLVLRNVKLIEELRASRKRLVAAQDEERRRLERNIHDGAQQQLVALGVKLRIADSVVDRDPARAHEMLAALQTETQEAIDDLRDLARGIYPPLLADRGLAAALEAQARKSVMPVDVEAAGVGRYPQHVEAAVYFSCLEALQNVAKYAEAARATIALEHQDGHLTFVVADDGRGFDPAATGYGTGLQGMADRLDAIGGALEIDSGTGRGTIVTGRVPVEVQH